MIIIRQLLEDYESINIKEDKPDWVQGNSYAAEAIVVHNKYYWKSVVDNNTEEPVPASPVWVKWGISNKYAALDDKGNTVTICDATTVEGSPAKNDMIMTFKWNNYNILALSNMNAHSVKIEIAGDNTFGSILWSTEEVISKRPCVIGWYQYFNIDRTCPTIRGAVPSGLLSGIPPLTGYMRITIREGAESHSAVGIVYAGNQMSVGCSIFPVELGIQDFSVHETDDYGTVKLVRRANRHIRTFKTLLPRHEVITVEDFIRHEVLGRTCLFVGEDKQPYKFGGLMLLGYMEGFDGELSMGDKQVLEFRVKEMI